LILLEVDGLVSFYGQFKVLHEVSLRVNNGEFIVVFGPNGHGKSTLLKTICGLHPPASGSIRFNGEEITKLPSSRLVNMGIVYIAEERHLFPEMTVLENLKLGASNTNAKPKEAENLEYCFELFPKLKLFSKRRASTLSGGEARMLAIGRGLMSNAKLLAIDEPSLGLAPNLRVDVFNKIKEINQSGIDILMVEQDVTQVSEFADRIYLIEDGRIVFEGSKEEVLSNKHVREVFLGI
jgi:branched-chain amino acid transport system ATP-binding protein